MSSFFNTNKLSSSESVDIIETIVYATETIMATKSGYVTTYGANKNHLTYLEELAATLGIVLCTLA